MPTWIRVAVTPTSPAGFWPLGVGPPGGGLLVVGRGVNALDGSRVPQPAAANTTDNANDKANVKAGADDGASGTGGFRRGINCIPEAGCCR